MIDAQFLEFSTESASGLSLMRRVSLSNTVYFFGFLTVVRDAKLRVAVRILSYGIYKRRQIIKNSPQLQLSEK